MFTLYESSELKYICDELCTSSINSLLCRSVITHTHTDRGGILISIRNWKSSSVQTNKI